MYYFFIFLSALIGLIVGSFTNALVWRVKTGKSLWGRSQCPRCGHKLSAKDLVPLFSFLLLRGRCRYCGRPISWHYPFIEFSAMILFALVYVKFAPLNLADNISIVALNDYQFALTVVSQWIFIALLLAIFSYDFHYGSIPDAFTITGILFAFLAQFLLGRDLWDFIIAVFIGGGFFMFQYVISRGRWIGGGDVNLGALMGVILGWPNIIPALFLAYFIGSIVSLGLITLKNKTWRSEVPFGPFLVIATIIVMFLADQIIEMWYYLVGI